MSTIITGPEPLYSLLLHYSISEHEQNAVAFLVNWMAQAGMQSHVDAAGNAVGIRDGGPDAMGRPPRDIVLLGHIDTVPGFIPVQVRDGKLYGRGAVDAKGPLAAFAAAAAQIALRPGWRIIVIGAVQEECAVSKGALQAVADYRPAFVIIGEPSGWERVTLGYKGRMLMDYSYARPLSHRAGPAMGACEQAVAYWNAVAARVAEINAERERLFDRVLLSLRQFHSEDDGFTETANMTLGFRLPPDIGPDALAAELRRLNDGGELQFSGAEVAFQGDRNNALVRALLAGIRTEGGRPGFVLKTGTSDMNVVGPRWRCPIVAYGPGDSELDHTPEEHIEIAEWERGVRVLAQALEHMQREE